MQVAVLKQDKSFTENNLDHKDYVDVFSPDLAMKLPKNTGINKHAIELVERK